MVTDWLPRGKLFLGRPHCESRCDTSLFGLCIHHFWCLGEDLPSLRLLLSIAIDVNSGRGRADTATTLLVNLLDNWGGHLR